MWDYVYYSLYLDNIDTGDHNAIQKYVYELVKKICILDNLNIITSISLCRLPTMTLDSFLKKKHVASLVRRTLQEQRLKSCKTK